MTANTIELRLARASLCLERGAGFTLNNAAGVVLTSRSGRAWLTMEGDARDIDLRAGDIYRIERDGLTLVNALEPSLVEVRVPRAQRVSWSDRLRRAWNWLARAAEDRARARMARGNYHF